MRILSVALLAAAAACSSGSSAPPPGGNPAPDFALLDVNQTSATFNQPVSPRDHIGRVSAYYFGSAT